MTDFQAEAVKLALDKMVRRGHFDICTVHQILQVTGGVPQRADYDALRLLHCVDFKDFTPRLRLEFPRLLQRVLEAPGFDLVVTYRALERPPCFELQTTK